ncbi:MAG: M20 family metallopeptidase [Deltaproteobacteria bacterium]|jgi:amidohydrolase|nr:M20 family metallopeptidase [Deltaproteobacteria bacterium]
MDPVKSRIGAEVDALAGDLFKVSEYLYNNPEIGYQEFKACEFLSRFMEEHGFKSERGTGGVQTAFLARPAIRLKGRPCVAFLAEYDALPGVGHGCGHNLIAAASVGAALALGRNLGEVQGTLALVGTPAEEGGGGKILLAEAGVFAEMDAAMMCHPSRLNRPGEEMFGRVKFKVEFFGEAAHASISPDRGVNALDAMVAAYNNISMLRQQIRPDARIHGIITHGGDAPNIIPQYTAGLFYVRAANRKYRDEVYKKVERCIEAAAVATGAGHKIEVGQPTFDPIKRNPPLEEATRANMEALGISVDPDDGRRGSSDIGNLSFYLPAIHPSAAIVDPEVPGHSKIFAEATMSPRGKDALLKAAKFLAMTGYDYLTSAELRERVREAFQKRE